MTIRKIKDYLKDAELTCQDSEHEPPKHMVFEPGEYEHECPSCRKITKFTVPLIT